MGVKDNNSPINNELTLINYPNPFNSSTNFYVKFPENMKGKPGSIKIFNANGQLVNTIAVKENSSSYWDGTDMSGQMMSSGTYYYRLVINGQTSKSGSMILLK